MEQLGSNFAIVVAGEFGSIEQPIEQPTEQPIEQLTVQPTEQLTGFGSKPKVAVAPMALDPCC